MSAVNGFSRDAAGNCEPTSHSRSTSLEVCRRGLAFIDDMHCEKFYRFVTDHLEGVVGYMADINGGISARTQADGTLTDSFGATSLGPPDCRILLSPNGDCGIALLSSKIA
jgi:hypothetical protein